MDSPFYLAIWVHCAFATETYFVYQLVQFMRNVRVIWTEAAAIDGCSSFQTLYKVIVPCRDPLWCPAHCSSSCGAATTLWALLYVITPGKYPMSLFVKLSMDE